MTGTLDPKRVGTAMLAELLGISTTTVRNLKGRHVLAEVAPGKYDLAMSIQAYIRHAGGRTIGMPASEAKRLVVEEQHRKLKLANDARDRTLLPAADVHAAVDAMAQTFRGQLEGLPGRMAAELAGIPEPAMVKDRLQDECRRVLADAAAKLDDIAAS